MRESSSRFGRSVACGAIVIGFAAVQALLASQAEAVPGLQRTTKTSVSNSNTSKTVTVTCRAGKRVLGGGGTVIGGRGQVVLERLEPVQTATNDRFVVGAREDGTGFSGSWRLTAYALCADTNPLPGYGILPSGSGSPSSNSPQSTLSFCLGQPLVGFGGRINGGAGQVHLSNLVPDSNGTTDFAVIAAREDANGFDGAWIANVYAVCANTPGQFHQGVRHLPGELSEQIRHRQLSRGHPGPQRRCSVVDARGLRSSRSQPRHRQGRDRPTAPQRHGEGRRGRDWHRRQLVRQSTRALRDVAARGWRPRRPTLRPRPRPGSAATRPSRRSPRCREPAAWRRCRRPPSPRRRRVRPRQRGPRGPCRGALPCAEPLMIVSHHRLQ